MNPAPHNPEELLTEKEAAELLRITPGTLRMYRTAKRFAGRAPTFVQNGRGRVLYLRSDLSAWVAARRRTPKHANKEQ